MLARVMKKEEKEDGMSASVETRERPELADRGSAEPAVRVDNLYQAFTKKGSTNVVLDDVSFSAARGEFLALIGPSGCGKTTVLRAIGGLATPTLGTTGIFGEPVSAHRGSVGIVFQSPALLPWLTARQNIEVALRQFGVSKRQERIERALAALKEVGLEEAAGKYPSELSGGMQQRVGIARALSHDPSVLLMDEPFGALDAITRETLDLQLLEFWEARNCTVVFVTHSIEEAVLLSDRVICMKPNPGRIVADHSVRFERPRTAAQLTDPAFLEEVRFLRGLITEREEEVRP